MNSQNYFIITLIIFGLTDFAFAHTVDSVGEYRLEIGWMNEPVVSKETNAIELFVSPLEPNIDLENQKFQNGIPNLEETLKLQLVYQEEKIMLSLASDHNIPGKYYAFVNPTISGFYQANILGKIAGENVSISMHPPKVEERSYIEFPTPSDITLTQLIDGHTTLLGEINQLKDKVAKLENANQQLNIGYIAIGLGITAIIIALFALVKTTSRIN